MCGSLRETIRQASQIALFFGIQPMACREGPAGNIRHFNGNGYGSELGKNKNWMIKTMFISSKMHISSKSMVLDGGFHKWRYPKNGWFRRENPNQKFGWFGGTPISGNLWMCQMSVVPCGFYESPLELHSQQLLSDPQHIFVVDASSRLKESKSSPVGKSRSHRI